MIISGNFVSKSFDMWKELRVIDNEINARKLYRDLTIDLTAYWEKKDIEYIVYRKEENIYNGNWFFWKFFFRNRINKKLLNSV